MHAPRFRRGLITMASALVILAAKAPAQEGNGRDKSDRVEKGEGVITKVEPIGEEKKGEPRRVKITINTAAVWRDYVRDTANFSTKPNAKEGANSIATKGEPESESTLVVAEVHGDTQLQFHLRSSTDDLSEGARTVEKAEKKDGSPASDDVKTSPKDEKAPRIGIKDLKPGLFVEFDARKGKAHKLVVMKPIGGPQTPASEADPKTPPREEKPK